MRAEGEAGVEEGRRHGQSQQRGLASPDWRCVQLRTPEARTAPSPERPPQVRARLGRGARSAPTAAAAGPAGCGCGCGRRRQTRRLPRPVQSENTGGSARADGRAGARRRENGPGATRTAVKGAMSPGLRDPPGRDRGTELRTREGDPDAGTPEGGQPHRSRERWGRTPVGDPGP